MMSTEDLTNRFTYHAPVGDRGMQHQQVRSDLEEIALAWNAILPDGREKSTAMTKLEEAMFWANAAIARQSA